MINANSKLQQFFLICYNTCINNTIKRKRISIYMFDKIEEK